MNLKPLIDRAAQSPSQFAVDVPHAVSPSTVGQWSRSADVSTWSHSVQIPGAVSMSFYAAEILLPASATLTVSAEGIDYVYTATDVGGGELWSRIGRGDSLTFELSVATESEDAVRLEIASLQAGYRAFAAGMSNHADYDELQLQALTAESAGASCAESWTCNVTPENEGAGNATVALVISNVRQCTGVVLNNVPGDGTPYGADRAALPKRRCQRRVAWRSGERRGVLERVDRVRGAARQHPRSRHHYPTRRADGRRAAGCVADSPEPTAGDRPLLRRMGCNGRHLRRRIHSAPRGGHVSAVRRLVWPGGVRDDTRGFARVRLRLDVVGNGERTRCGRPRSVRGGHIRRVGTTRRNAGSRPSVARHSAYVRVRRRPRLRTRLRHRCRPRSRGSSTRRPTRAARRAP